MKGNLKQLQRGLKTTQTITIRLNTITIRPDRDENIHKLYTKWTQVRTKQPQKFKMTPNNENSWNESNQESPNAAKLLKLTQNSNK